jgi:phosphoadenosine phosphosulfate reductase
MLSVQEIRNFPKSLRRRTPQEIIQWAVDTFWPEIAMSSSFQTQSMPLLHMVTRLKRSLPVFFIDTGYHFWETSTFP